MFDTTALRIRFKFSMNMSREAFTLEFQLVNKGGAVFVYKLVEQGLLWAVAIIGGVTNGTLAWRKHAAVTPTEVLIGAVIR